MPDIIPLFSTPLYKDRVSFDQKIMSKIESLKYLPHDADDSTDGSLTTEKNILSRGDFRQIKNLIDDHVRHYVFDILQIRKLNLFISNSWINKHKPGDGARDHIHTNSIFSGVLYLNVPEGDAGNISFHLPFIVPTYTTSTLDPETKENNLFNSRVWNITPKTGDILIFPSHLMHGVATNTTKENRYSLAFNYFVKGEISNQKTSELTL